MNTIETERLVRRIHSLLKGEGETAMAPKLAEQFAAVCASAALRLEQCRSMIEAGAAPQAVQLAETPPNLMDLVTLLEFREADQWRQYCQEKGLAVAEKLNARAVAKLNDCYSSGISPQHPVYAAYREAVLAKNDEAARMALVSIARLNPADTNAAAELTRLDDKLLAERLQKLAQYLAGDEDAALRELDRIEALGCKTKLTGGVFQRGQMLRCKRLLAEGETMMLNGSLSETVAQMDLIAQLKAEYGLEWPDEWNDRIARLHDWCRGEADSQQTEAEYQGQLSQLENLVRDSHELSPKNAKASRLKAELDSLRKNRRRLEKFARPFPADLKGRCQQRETRLEQQMARASRNRLVWIAGGVSAALFILGALAGVLWGMQRANTLAAGLRTASDKHEVRQLSSLVKQAQGGMLISTPQLKAALAAANAEIASQMTPLEEFENVFKKLPAQLESTATLQDLNLVGNTFSTAEQSRALLSPDLQQETLPRLQDFRNRWVNYCAQILPRINEQVEGNLKNEDVLPQTGNIADLGQFEGRVAAAIPHVEELSRIITNLNRYVHLEPTLAQRCNALHERLRQTQADIEKLKSAVDGLSKSRTLSDYAQNVSEVASIPLPQSEYVQAARQANVVNELKDSPEALSRRLLTGDKTILWDILKREQRQDLVPAKVSTGVRSHFMELLRDYAVNGNHHRFDIYLDDQRSKHQTWITSDALRNDEGWHSVPGWNMDSPNNCEFNSLDYGCFGGKYRLSDKVLVFEVKDTSLSDLTIVWNGSGFSSLINPRAMTYNLAPLKVADALCTDRRSSPLLRAYLLRELIFIMDQQPEESGLLFIPELQNLPARLDEAGAEQLHSGDWFIAARVAAMQPGLDKLFDALKAPSYEKGAARVMDGIASAVKDGFSFSGYVKPDGSPNWASTPADGYVWGYQQGKGEPGLLYLVHDGQARSINKALPLTPLLLFTSDLPAIKAKVGVATGAPAPSRWLPPLFSAVLPAP